jgi:ubiquinone/menaquinone biosynthesis C-methylase UbiE
MVAADIGAGEGKWTEALAMAVGQEGHVFSTEVKTDLVEDLRRHIERRGLGNVTVILGDQLDVGLPTGCCDAVLIRMVYHHFQDPGAMRASLHRALKPEGLVAIVDIIPQEHWRQLDGVPDRGGHGIEPRALVREMTNDGFELVSRHDDWNGDDDRYCVVFRSVAKAR